MHHCMIDIETVGSRPNAPILSIGAVKFDPDAGKMGAEFYVDVDPVSAFAHGVPCGRTFKWWMEQSDEARKAAVCGVTALPDALKQLTAFYPKWKDVKVWGNGPSFDMSILEYGYTRALNKDAPWAFWNVRDCRTVSNMAGLWPPKIGGAGVHHNALDDAKHQAKWVTSMWQGLRNVKRVEQSDDLIGDL